MANNTIYETDSDEVILFDGLKENVKIKRFCEWRNRRRAKIAEKNKEQYKQMYNSKNNDFDKEIIKMYYRSGILEDILFQKLLEDDREGVLEYNEKLSEVFVDMDILLSERMKKEGDYKYMTEKIMEDKNGITELIELNKIYWKVDDEVDEILDDLKIPPQSSQVNFKKGLLCLSY